MGNRAYVAFRDKATFTKKEQKTRIPMVYLHWNGGPESVYAFVRAGRDLNLLAHDPSYALARFCQIVGNYFGGGLSLGVAHVTPLEAATEENGLYVVTGKGEIGARYSAIYRNPAETFRAFAPEVLAQQERLAWQHKYNKPEDGSPGMVDQLVEIMRKACPPEEKAA